MSQSMPDRSKPCSGPSSGSADTNRTAAGTVRRWSTRSRWLRSSTLTPIHTFDGHGRLSASFASRVARLVRIWYVWRGVAAITAKTRRTKLTGTRAWNRSLMELTKTTRGSRHRYGNARSDSWTVTPNPGPDVRGSPSAWYLADPIAFNRLARANA